jgi:hypothetical protein
VTNARSESLNRLAKLEARQAYGSSRVDRSVRTVPLILFHDDAHTDLADAISARRAPAGRAAHRQAASRPPMTSLMLSNSIDGSITWSLASLR